MKNITRHVGTLENVKRTDSSVNGNPRFSFTIDGYTAVTRVDSAFGYCIQNMEGKNCVAELGTHYGRLTLHNILETMACRPERRNRDPYSGSSRRNHIHKCRGIMA